MRISSGRKARGASRAEREETDASGDDGPGIVTALRPKDARAARWVVEIDGRPAGTLSLPVVETLGLRLNEAVDEAMRAAITEASESLRVYDRALNMLAARPRCAKDLADQLRVRGERRAHVDAAVEKLVAAGLLDDEAYARQYVRSRVAVGHGRRRLLFDLVRRGVAREVAEEAIRTVLAEPEVDATDALERVARRKLEALARFDAPTRERRLQAFLARRGFEADQIRRWLIAARQETK